tara:strand:+ start:117 stop:332 length:216 start_codon:yes stop_codon:yes gene_type:complete
MPVLCLGLENILTEDPEHTVPAAVLELPTYFGFSINRCGDVRNPQLKNLAQDSYRSNRGNTIEKVRYSRQT